MLDITFTFFSIFTAAIITRDIEERYGINQWLCGVFDPKKLSFDVRFIDITTGAWGR
jgi:hypothetical protein